MIETIQEEVGAVNRKSAPVLVLLLAALLTGCGGQAAEPSADRETVPEPAAKTPSIQESAAEALPEPEAGPPSWVAAYCDQVLACEAESPDAEYALIDLVGGEIPALAAGHTGYEVSLYQYGGGELHTLMDHWAYGAGGNHGYEYLPGQGVIRNYDTDLAGLILYTRYDRVTEDWTLDGYTLALWNFEDRNHNYFMDGDEEETLGQAGFYYLDGQALTAEEYDSYAIGGRDDYLYIWGSKSCQELLEQLNGLTAENSKEALS